MYRKSLNESFYQGPKRYWTEDRIIQALKELPQDKPINKKTLIEYNKKGLICHPSSINDRIGTIKEACKLAGIRCDTIKGVEAMHQTNTIWNKENIIALIKKLPKKYKDVQPIKVPEYSKNGDCCTADTIRKHFSTIADAFKEAGIKYKNHYWTDERILQSIKNLHDKFGPLYKAQIPRFCKQKMCCGKKLIVDRFGTFDNAARLAGFEFVEPKDVGHEFNGRKGRKETEWLNRVEKEKGVKLYRQYRIDVNDSEYFFVDGYDKKNNTAYEFDDAYHHYGDQSRKDNNREYKIKKKIGCNFIREKDFNLS